MVDHSLSSVLYFIFCGHSSVVERLVANEKVEGSNPFARSIISLQVLKKIKLLSKTKDLLFLRGKRKEIINWLKDFYNV